MYVNLLEILIEFMDYDRLLILKQRKEVKKIV